MKFLEKNLVKIDVNVTHPDEAIKGAGDLLLESNLIEPAYIDAMIHSYHENGAYFVLAPQIAIPHARPEDGVKEAAVSLITLKDPVNFGSKNNDPVKLVFGLGASTSDEHLLLLKELTVLLNDSDNVRKIMNATSYDDIQKILKG